MDLFSYNSTLGKIINMFASYNALNEYFGSYMNIRVLLLQNNKIFLHLHLQEEKKLWSTDKILLTNSPFFF